jgi:hypothetical protein
MIAWVHLGMLAGLAALAIPIVVHLLRNRRFELADLGSVRFLRRAVQETTRWRRLRDVLLLFLRLLAIALLVGLFARPYVAGDAAQRDRDQGVVVLLDASGSMSGRVLGRPLWETVQEVGAAIVAKVPESAQTTMAIFADSAAAADPLPTKPALGAGTDYDTALRWAADRLRASKARHKEVFLVTDLQRSGLPARPRVDWPPDIAVRIREVPVPGPHNLAVAAVTCLTPFPAEEARFAVQVSCSGTLPPGVIEVTFQIEGREAELRSLPMGSQEVVFAVRPPPSGICRGTARVASADAWPDDDGLAFAVGLRRALRLLIVDGHPAREAHESGSYFLATALAGARDGEGRAAYALEVRGDVGGIDQADAVLLCDVQALPEALSKPLAEAVTRGTGLVLFLGDNSDEAAVRGWRQAGLLPAAVSATGVPVPEAIGAWDGAHPVLRPFASAETGNLRRIVFRDAFEIRPDEGSAVLAWLSGGQPAIVAGSRGQGRVVLVSNPCSRAWTDWPTERIFLPLVREIAAYVTGLRERDAGVVARTACLATAEPPGILAGEPLTFVSPDPLESRVERCPEADFRAALGIGPAPEDDGSDDSALPPGRERRQEWWRWLALGLVLVLVIEGLIGDWPRRLRTDSAAASA